MTVKGFFSQLHKPARQQPSLVPRCGPCGLRDHCQSPLMPVDGEGRRKILIIGEAPAKNEDREGKPFVGAAGQELQRFLDRIEVDLREDCWITNAVICRPHTDDGRNRNPTPKEVDYCRPNVVNALQRLKPEVVIPLGAPAVRSLIGWLWKGDPGGINRWVGWRIPSQRLNAWVCPAWHPSHLLRMERNRDVPDRIFLEHLRAACDLSGTRPWAAPPDYASRVRTYLDPAAAAAEVRRLIGTGRPLAFDFETDRLKPDHPDAEIVCCSVSDGRVSAAFPWAGEAIEAMGELVDSPNPKWGWHIKFEERWVMKFFGRGVRNWDSTGADGMVLTHVLDNRPEICSVKFQAFAVLGAEPWAEHVSPYLKADGSNEKNKIREFIDKYGLNSLLVYCGVDSIHEWKVVNAQRKQLVTTPSP